MRGVAAVEFGLMLPILILLLFGIVEYGRMFYQYNTLVKSVRDGARYISVYSPTDPSYGTYKTQASCMVVYGNTGCTGSALVTGLTTSKVSIAQLSSGTVKMVKVATSGFSLGYITGYFPNTLTFGDISITMRQAES